MNKIEKCHNHHNVDALSFCHNCKRYYCGECLIQGADYYYYCKAQKCQSVMKKDVTDFKENLKLDKQERLKQEKSSNKTFFQVLLVSFFSFGCSISSICVFSPNLMWKFN